MKVIDYMEGAVKETDVSEHDWWALQRDVDLDCYDNLRQACQDLVNIIEDDRVFSYVEWNIMREWYNTKGFSTEDEKYFIACGYEYYLDEWKGE